MISYIIVGRRFLSYKTNKSYRINYGLNCNSTNVVYMLICRVCGLQYVGSTITSFRSRFNNHKNRINFHSKASDSDKDKDDLIYKHFCSEGHHGVSDIEVMVIDRVFGEERLRDKEGQWAYRLRIVAPDELNSNDFLYSQNRRSRARN